MTQTFFNRILHLINARPKQGKRMIGLGAVALWELWQRINELDQVAKEQRANKPDRKRQGGGGRKKEAEVLCRLLVTPCFI